MRNPFRKEVAAEAPPAEETFSMVVHKRRAPHGTTMRTEWRLTLKHGRERVVETEWKPRTRFFQDLLLHQEGRWSQWLLEGVGRPML